MIHICDNFFSHPHKVRSIAFKGKYVGADNYPGLRCDHVRGLEIFNSINPKVMKSRDLFHKDPSNLIKRDEYGRIRKEVNSFYKPNIIAANKFNRCVIFPATNFHRAQNFFGTSLENSRLTLVSFMDKDEI